MPRERTYRFMVTSDSQSSTSREFQRNVRSHAASVSRSDRVRRRQTRRRRQNEGEGIIDFDTEPLELAESREPGDLPAAAEGDALPITSVRIQSASNQPDNTDQSLATGRPLSPYRLRPDYLSGNTFSPLQNLATYRAPFLPGIVDHYIYNLTIPIPELDGSSVVPVFRAIWLPIVFHDPVVFQVVVLFAATHYALFADPARYNGLYLELLTLKQSALLALIQAVQTEQITPPILTNRGRTPRDILIAAAAKMASYEAIFGVTEAFHLHMSTVTRLLRQQGGPATLGMDGFLARLLTFIDTNSAFLLGTNLYLEEFGLSNRIRLPQRQRQSLLPRWFEENVPRADEQMRGSNVVNLERFLGEINSRGSAGEQ